MPPELPPVLPSPLPPMLPIVLPPEHSIGSIGWSGIGSNDGSDTLGSDDTQPGM